MKDWWDDLLFTEELSAGEIPYQTMLRVIAYDIAHPKRLRRVAKVCERFGARVQLSVFECWLEGDRFDALVAALKKEICPREDQIVVYTLDAATAKRRTSIGMRASFTDRLPVCVVL